MFHRHDLPRPIRDISNLVVYFKYLRELDKNTREGRKWLRVLDKNIKIMGFNFGVEAFETYYEGDKKVGRRILRNRLIREVKIEEGIREVVQLNLVIEKLKQANPQLVEQMEEAKRQQQNANRRKPANLSEDINDEFNIDISHVNRAMGNNNGNNNNDDLDNLLDDIF